MTAKTTEQISFAHPGVHLCPGKECKYKCEMLWLPLEEHNIIVNDLDFKIKETERFWIHHSEELINKKFEETKKKILSRLISLQAQNPSKLIDKLKEIIEEEMK